MDDLNLLLRKNKKAIVIVAHPDDETIWMGGCLLRYKNIDWSIFSLCRLSDDDRAPKFKQVCDYYEAQCVITDLDDEGELDMDTAVKEAERLIAEKVGDSSYDYIFTHGQNGEYGHIRHVTVNKAIKNLISKRIISPSVVFYFSYKKDENNEHKVLASEKANLLVELSDKEYREKKRIVSDMHGYPMKGIDVGYCTNPEAFKVEILNNK
jgi:LmbE family N-acetylglucosaminyl deacetylase